MIYEGWQISNTVSLDENIRQAIAVYIKKHGIPPNILEYSVDLKEVKLPEGLNMVVDIIKIPRNILLVGKSE